VPDTLSTCLGRFIDADRQVLILLLDNIIEDIIVAEVLITKSDW